MDLLLVFEKIDMPIKNRLLSSKYIFIITLIVTTLVVIGVWILGIKDHRTIASNGVISTLILSITFFLFISIALFRGIKMKDEVGNLMNHSEMVFWSYILVCMPNNYCNALLDILPSTKTDIHKFCKV